MVIRVANASIKIDTVEVKSYVKDYDMTMGADQPFPIIRMTLNPANAVDNLVTIAEGSSLAVSAANAGTFTVVSITLLNNEYEIVGVHSSYRAKTMLSSAYTDTPATIFSTIAQALGYASGDVVVDASAYGSIKIPAGENLWDVLQYLGYLTDARVWFTPTKAYMTDWSTMPDIPSQPTPYTYGGTTYTVHATSGTADYTSVADCYAAMVAGDIMDIQDDQIYTGRWTIAKSIKVMGDGSITTTDPDYGILLGTGNYKVTFDIDVIGVSSAMSVYSTLFIENGTYTSSFINVIVSTNGKLVVNGGTFTSATYGIYLDGSSSYAWVNGGLATKIYVNYGTLYKNNMTASVIESVNAINKVYITNGSNIITYFENGIGYIYNGIDTFGWTITGTGTIIRDDPGTSIIIGGASKNTDTLGNPSIDRSIDEVINSVKVSYELGAKTATDATSISAYGTSYATSRNYSTEATTSATTPSQDAQAVADGIIALYKDASLGIGYQVSERVMDTTYKAWTAKYDEYGKGTITDNINGVSAAALPMTMWTHHYPMYSTTYWFGKGNTNSLTTELSKLSNKMTSKVSAGDVTADLSNRPISLQVYGDQTLDTFDETTLTGFYLGKIKDGSGNDVYLWAGVNAGAEQVRMDTDGKMKAGAGAVVLDKDGVGIFCGTTTNVRQDISWYSSSSGVKIGRVGVWGSSEPSMKIDGSDYLTVGATKRVSIEGFASRPLPSVQILGNTGFVDLVGYVRIIGGSNPVNISGNGVYLNANTGYNTYIDGGGTATDITFGEAGRLDASRCPNGIRLPTISNTDNLPASAQEGDMIAYNGSPPRIYVYLSGSWRYEDV